MPTVTAPADLRLRFDLAALPRWIAHARSGGVTGVDAHRGLRESWLARPRTFLEDIIWPQLDWLAANDLPLALCWDHPYGTNVDEKMDFDARLEALANPLLRTWCDAVPAMIEEVALVTDYLLIYAGTLPGDEDMVAARKAGRTVYAQRIMGSLEDYRGADSVAFDQVCQLRGDEPMFRDLQRIRRWLGKPCWAESRPREDTISWATAGWGFIFQDTHLFMTGREWYSLSALRSVFPQCPIARMTIGVPKSPNHIDPSTGEPWTSHTWGDHSTRRILADGDSVVRDWRGALRSGMRRQDFE